MGQEDQYHPLRPDCRSLLHRRVTVAGSRMILGVLVVRVGQVALEAHQRVLVALCFLLIPSARFLVGLDSRDILVDPGGPEVQRDLDLGVQEDPVGHAAPECQSLGDLAGRMNLWGPLAREDRHFPTAKDRDQNMKTKINMIPGGIRGTIGTPALPH